LAQPRANLIKTITAPFGSLQEQQHGKEGAPLGRRALTTHEHITHDQSPAGVQTALELQQQGLVFSSTVRVQNIGDEYGIESLRQSIARKIRADYLHSPRHTGFFHGSPR
jgi:hypothetical protein